MTTRGSHPKGFYRRLPPWSNANGSWTYEAVVDRWEARTIAHCHCLTSSPTSSAIPSLSPHCHCLSLHRHYHSFHRPPLSHFTTTASRFTATASGSTAIAEFDLHMVTTNELVFVQENREKRTAMFGPSQAGVFKTLTPSDAWDDYMLVPRDLASLTSMITHDADGDEYNLYTRFSLQVRSPPLALSHNSRATADVTQLSASRSQPLSLSLSRSL